MSDLLYWATCLHCSWTGNSYTDHHEAAAEQQVHLDSDEGHGHSTTVTNNEDAAAEAKRDEELYGS